MLYIPKDKMNVNKFVYTKLPTKREIFARTGQVAVSPNGVYTQDESAELHRTTTESAEAFARAAEKYVEDLPASEE